LDEMLDRRIRGFLPRGMEGVTVRERGWASLKNGELLEAAQEEFDALLTTDRGIPAQQNLSRYDLAVVVLRGRTNSLADLEPLVPGAVRALQEARPGTAVAVGG
jgi:predicted nuclease of predicted toxin-antitoxin system